MKKSLKICVLSLMSSFVFVSTCIKIDIPVGPLITMIGFSNVFCLLSGLMTDPISAGLCSGVGSAAFDLCDARYTSSIHFTFVSKFLLAYTCGKVFRKLNKKSSMIALISGSLVFLMFRVAKIFLCNHIALRLEFWPNIFLTSKGTVSTIINLVIGILCALLLKPLFEKAIKRANLEGVFE